MNPFISGLTADNQEQLIGTEAVIACKVTGLTKALDSVTWKRTSDDLDVTTGVDGYTSSEGSFVSGTNSQTTTLTIGAAKNIGDTTFECSIESTEHGKTAETMTVHLKVFGKYILVCRFNVQT